MALPGRHFSEDAILVYLEPNPNLPDHLRDISEKCQELAEYMVDVTADSSGELTTGLRKLLEAKDCFVRAKLVER